MGPSGIAIGIACCWVLLKDSRISDQRGGGAIGYRHWYRLLLGPSQGFENIRSERGWGHRVSPLVSPAVGSFSRIREYQITFLRDQLLRERISLASHLPRRIIIVDGRVY